VLLQLLISSGEFIICLTQSLGFQGIKDFSVVNGGDQSVGDGVDGFIEVCLSSEHIKSSLRGEWWVLRSDGGLDWVKWDG
jgi:hypothetical protein